MLCILTRWSNEMVRVVVLETVFIAYSVSVMYKCRLGSDLTKSNALVYS